MPDSITDDEARVLLLEALGLSSPQSKLGKDGADDKAKEKPEPPSSNNQRKDNYCSLR
jgi:hypothetical protein